MTRIIYYEHGIPGDGGVQKRRIASADQYFPSAMAPLFPHSTLYISPLPVLTLHS